MLNFKNWFQILETDVTKLESTSSMADLQYLALKMLNIYREMCGGQRQMCFIPESQTHCSKTSPHQRLRKG